jgi:Mat/Ecp fimbriae major subunit
MTVNALKKSAAGLGIIALSLVGLSGTASAATTSASASANILTPIALSKTADLNFATIIPGASADTVVVSAAGGRTCGAALTCSGSVASAAFNVAGSANTSYAITLPSTISLTSGSNSMTVDNFTSSKVGNTSTLSGTGTDSFTVGARLNVGASQAAGAYTGSFSVSVDYN